MRIGIGLPAAVPGADMTTLGQWAAESERAGFAAVGVIDRLVYANLDPLIALAVAAGRTERVDLATTVLSIGWATTRSWSPSSWPRSTLSPVDAYWRGSGWVAGPRTTSPARFRRPGTPRAGSRRWRRCVRSGTGSSVGRVGRLPSSPKGGRRCCSEGWSRRRIGGRSPMGRDGWPRCSGCPAWARATSQVRAASRAAKLIEGCRSRPRSSPSGTGRAGRP